ncbi:MAG: winged helix DNA-binding protein [Alphaproteobacteria bacterium]|nr:winged helix DNA-binding protein [Alphaproteobacteria bacterium]
MNAPHELLSPEELETCQSAVDVCPSFNLKKAARAVSRLFDEALQPAGLRSGQLVMLLNVASSGEPTYSQLARDLVMDNSTIARSLRPLEREGLLEVVAGPDRRRKTVRLTSVGAERIRQAVPLWNRAMAEFSRSVGDADWKRTVGDLNGLLESVRGY